MIMRKTIYMLILIAWMLSPCVFADTTPAKAENPVPPSGEDLKIIAAMEYLELLDLVEDMDLIKDLDFIVEEDQNEKKN